MNAATSRTAVGWWRALPPVTPMDRSAAALAAEVLFPSGRAAISQALEALHLPPAAAVALAGAGSECLTRIVQRSGVPVSIGALDDPLVAAAVVYEPWGWPLTDTAWDHLEARLAGRPLIVDRV